MPRSAEVCRVPRKAINQREAARGQKRTRITAMVGGDAAAPAMYPAGGSGTGAPTDSACGGGGGFERQRGTAVADSDGGGGLDGGGLGRRRRGETRRARPVASAKAATAASQHRGRAVGRVPQCRPPPANRGPPPGPPRAPALRASKSLQIRIGGGTEWFP